MENNETLNPESTSANAAVESGAATPQSPKAPTSPNADASDLGQRLTEFYDGGSEEVVCFANDPSKATVTKYVITTRSNKRIWLRQKPAESHNSVSYTLTPEGYCNNATTSKRNDLTKLAELGSAVSSAQAAHATKVTDQLNEAEDKQAMASLLHFDATKLLDYI